MSAPGELAALVASEARPLTGAPGDHDELLEMVGDAQVVLLGEASHGTHEFYRQRAVITKRLIEERGFTAVAVEADWPDAYRVNRYVKGANDDADSEAALGGFRRFPTWMWRNADVLDFVGWLRAHNERPASRPASTVSTSTRSTARSRRSSPISTGSTRRPPKRPAGATHASRASKKARITATRSSPGSPRPAGPASTSSCGSWSRAARATCAATASPPKTSSSTPRRTRGWWSRPRSTTAACSPAPTAPGTCATATWPALSSAWSLTSDATAAARPWSGPTTPTSATPARPRCRTAASTTSASWPAASFPGRTALVGFTTYDGTVSAASNWNEPVERKRVRPALEGSVESLLHEAGQQAGNADFWLPFTPGTPLAQALDQPMLERAIGVIYRPESERISHYFNARPAAQFDALIHFDRTRAVEPLEPTGEWQAGEPPETYPTAI